MGAATGIKAIVPGWRGNRRIYRVNSVTTNQAAIIAPFQVMNRYVGNLQPMPRRFPELPRPVTVRVGITSPSRVRDAKFTEKGSTFCTA
jgi:hypothetical protein